MTRIPSSHKEKTFFHLSVPPAVTWSACHQFLDKVMSAILKWSISSVKSLQNPWFSLLLKGYKHSTYGSLLALLLYIPEQWCRIFETDIWCERTEETEIPCTAHKLSNQFCMYITFHLETLAGSIWLCIQKHSARLLAVTAAHLSASRSVSQAEWCHVYLITCSL